MNIINSERALLPVFVPQSAALHKLEGGQLGLGFQQARVQVLNEALLGVLVPELLDLLHDLDFLALGLQVQGGLNGGVFDLEEEFGVEEVLLLELVDAVRHAQVREELAQVEVDAHSFVFFFLALFDEGLADFEGTREPLVEKDRIVDLSLDFGRLFGAVEYVSEVEAGQQVLRDGVHELFQLGLFRDEYLAYGTHAML